MKLSRIVSRVCVTVLAFFGYGCSNGDEPLMYGTPMGDWEIKGNVTDEAGKAVSNATIKVTRSTDDSGVYSICDTHSDDQGNYITTGGGICFGRYKVVCLPDNPALRADSTLVDMHYVKDKKHKDDLWYTGHAEATVNFILKASTDEEDENSAEGGNATEDSGNTSEKEEAK